MLHDFLNTERAAILALCKTKVIAVGGPQSSSPELERGLPVFYEELIEVLSRQAVDDSGNTVIEIPVGAPDRATPAKHGKESLRLGYTISQVVHGYGAVCQAITEFAQKKDTLISPQEFHQLNHSLDVAIAEAVTEFSNGQLKNISSEEVSRLGFLAHELRNSLSSATLAQALIKRGIVGTAGSTSRTLDQSLQRATELIDRALSEVRLKNEPVANKKDLRVIDLVSEVEATSIEAASTRSIRLLIDVDSGLFINADPHLVISALANLVQNAIKFTKEGGEIRIRSKEAHGQVILEIEDECGGLPKGRPEELFQPFTQKGSDRSGIGLGLTISRRAITLNEGNLTVRNLPGKGCIFSISLPQIKDLRKLA
jgi:signal transduction histidine kinase